LLPGLTALDNVALPLLYRGVHKRERREKAASMLEKVGLGDRMNFKPNQLSGGQRQRVAIARAIVGDPQILLADEPTGALDSASGHQVMEIFRRLNEEGITILMITHAEDVAQQAHKIYYIHDGILSSRRDGETQEEVSQQ
jgi:putative ABC transport system ATP-binding protein